jgi:glycosyltransferase involved in cell wall biosynthesis
MMDGETRRRAALGGRTILQIIPDLDAGGAERTTLDIAAALARLGARPLVASRGGRLTAELQAEGGILIPFPAATKNPIRMAANVVKLRALMRAERVSLIHARSRAPAWSALPAARALGVPFVTTFHGIYGGRSAAKLLYNSIMARGDRVIANSAYTAAFVRRHYLFAGPAIEVIHRGADLARFSPAAVAPERVRAIREAWGVPAEAEVVLLPGRLTRWKGQIAFVEAARRHLAAGGAAAAQTMFVIAGDAQGRDGYVAELDAAIAAAGLAGRVRRAPHILDMPAAYLASRLVVVASVEPEAFGRVAVEAQAMGVPAVVTDLGAAPETVLAPPETPDAMRTGWRVPAGDAEAMAGAIATALAMRPSARAALGERARRHVEASFSLEAMVARTLDLYADLLDATNR